MAWFKIDDGFSNSKPVLRLQRRVRSSAIGLWTLAGAWSAKEMTDGFIPDYVIEELASTPAIAAHLVKCGLWETAPDGWQFKGWEKYQPTREQIMEAREKEAERKRRYRESQRRPSGTDTGQTEGHQQESGHPDPTRPDPTLKEEANASSKPRKRATRIPNDFQVTDQMKDWHRDNCPQVDGPRETVKFINYWQAKAGKDATKLDWVATWRNWILTAAERTPTTAPTGDIDPDAILGRDYWTPDPPPDGLTIEQQLAWTREQRATHAAERLEQARRKANAA